MKFMNIKTYGLLLLLCLFTGMVMAGCLQKQEKVDLGKSTQIKNTTAKKEHTVKKEKKVMKIKVENGSMALIYELNNSTAAKEFVQQLPLTIEVENFGDKEKIFYPPKHLSLSHTPLADAQKGTLAYYEPWGNVVMFYKPFGKGAGLYELGEIIHGKDVISQLQGTLKIYLMDE